MWFNKCSVFVLTPFVHWTHTKIYRKLKEFEPDKCVFAVGNVLCIEHMHKSSAENAMIGIYLTCNKHVWVHTFIAWQGTNANLNYPLQSNGCTKMSRHDSKKPYLLHVSCFTEQVTMRSMVSEFWSWHPRKIHHYGAREIQLVPFGNQDGISFGGNHVMRH